jgi:tetratricopeptide (TPR) repeat protein
MNCDTISREGIVELYLAGELASEDVESFELHYFACGRCFEELQTARALAGALGANASSIRAAAVRPAPAWIWAGAAAALAALLAVGVWLVPTARVEPKAAQAQPAPAADFTQVARLEPAPYVAIRVRGSEDAAELPFRNAMIAYSKGDYRSAAAGLETVARLEPKSPGPLFYLGVSELLDGRTPDGIAALERVVAVGDSPYLEQAEFYLGKAFLRQNDAEGAKRWWKQTAELHGDREAEARALLGKLP